MHMHRAWAPAAPPRAILHPPLPPRLVSTPTLQAFAVAAPAQVREARLRAFDAGQTPSWFVFFRTQRAAAMASQCIIHAEDNRRFRVRGVETAYAGRGG
jgi:hypothetical protein